VVKLITPIILISGLPHEPYSHSNSMCGGDTMVEIITTIPEKKATMLLVPKTRPTLEGSMARPIVRYERLVVPSGLNREFFRKCGIDLPSQDDSRAFKDIALDIQDANREKDIYLRFAGERPLSVVTGKFQEMQPGKVARDIASVLGVEPTVRYFQADESLQLNFPIKSRFKNRNLLVDTGSYGTYGGSGYQAMSYGLSAYNPVCSNWTVFLRQTLTQVLKLGDMGGRIIHITGTDMSETLGRLVETTQVIDRAFDEGHDKKFNFDELDAYFTLYEPRGLNKKIADTIRSENPKGTNAHDLSYRLTQLCQDPKLSDVTRGRIEHLAGEVLLCYDPIMDHLREGIKDVAKATVITQN